MRHAKVRNEAAVSFIIVTGVVLAELYDLRQVKLLDVASNDFVSLL